MNTHLTVVVPMAGLGTRLRPHTWSKPKPLVSVAGKAVLGHVLDMFAYLPNPENVDFVFIIGYLGDQAITYIHENYPHVKAHFVVQEEMRGQSQAIEMARQYIDGPTIVTFVDTLIETDLKFLETEEGQAVVCVKPVPDPRRFGVAVIDDDGWVQKLVEKPADMSNNLAVVGFYYFKDGCKLLQAIDKQIELGIQLKNEYFLADAVNIMLEEGLRMKVRPVDVWLDAGTPDTLLETNRYLLDNGKDNSAKYRSRGDLVINPPVFIHPEADVTSAIIGPYVSMGAGCKVDNSIIRDSILEDEAMVSGAILENSLVGRKACITRRPGVLNLGDQTEVTL